MDEKKVHSLVSLLVYVSDFSLVPTNCTSLCSRSWDSAVNQATRRGPSSRC